MTLLYILLWLFAFYGAAHGLLCLIERFRKADRVITEAPIRLDDWRTERSNVRQLSRAAHPAGKGRS